MKNTFGNNITVTLFGESHGPCVGAVVDGVPAGIRIDMDLLARMMNQRKASSNISTPRQEKDIPQIVSGVLDGVTEGTPVTFLIPNEKKISHDYNALAGKPRPSHADYAARMRYRGYEDANGGGHFSGRLTAPLVAAGALCMQMLAEKGIAIGTHIASLHGIKDRPFDEENVAADIAVLAEKKFPVLDEKADELMRQAILEASAGKDSLGGILDTAVIGLDAGIGEPWFDSVESMLAHGLFSIGAVKGVEFGTGFGFEALKGSQANDPFVIRDGKVVTLTNHNGGLNGGLTNGMPVRFRTVVKPTPSIAQKQKTVDLEKFEETEIEISGRHDPAIIHRARAAVDAVTAITLCDLLTARYGTSYFEGEGK